MSGVDEQEEPSDFPSCGCSDFEFWCGRVNGVSLLYFNPDNFLGSSEHNKVFWDSERSIELGIFNKAQAFNLIADIVCNDCSVPVTEAIFVAITEKAAKYFWYHKGRYFG